jgi:hypothetical protein
MTGQSASAAKPLALHDHIIVGTDRHVKLATNWSRDDA